MMIGQKLYFAGLLFSALAAGCASRGNRGGGEGGAGGETGEGKGGGSPTGAPEAHLRVAHLSPTTSKIDVCLLHDHDNKKSVGPLMSSVLHARDGLNYAEVTRYLRVPEGTYTIRLVESGSHGCEKGLTGIKDVKGVTLTGKAHYTLAALEELPAAGQVTAPLQVKAFTDQTEPASGRARLRFIHAALAAPAVDVGVGAGTAFRPLFRNVKFGQTGETADAKDGYLTTEPVSRDTLVLRASGAGNDLATLPGFTLGAGEVATTFAIGEATSTTRPISALVCADTDEAGGNLSRCTRLTK